MLDLTYRDVLSDKYSKIRFKIYKDLLSPFLKDDIKLLDVGCYTADMLKLIPFRVDYLGIDFDVNALEIAKQRGAKIIRLDLENEEIPLTEKFDIILATEILEHLMSRI